MGMLRRRALVVGLAGLMAACAGPNPSGGPSTPTPQPVRTTPPLLPTVPPPTAAPTQPPSPTQPPAVAPTAAPAPPQPTPSPAALDDQVALNIRLWNGSAESGGLASKKSRFVHS